MDEQKQTQPTTQQPVAPEKQVDPAAETKVAPEPVQKDEAKPKEKPAKKKFKNVTRSEGGLNLIPPLTEAEKKTERSKFRLNLSAAYTLLFLVVLSIMVLGFNGISKIALNTKKEQLYELEKQTNLRSDLLSYNDEILRRISLYKDIESSTFSSKDLVEYWQKISEGYADITTIELTQGLGFTVTGSASSLTNVSRLWFLLANDKHVSKVNLKTVVKDGSTARFTFEGELNFDEFLTQ